MAGRSPLMLVGTITAVVAISQIIICILSFLQYYCYIDILRWTTTFTYIKILYFNVPECGSRVYLSEVIPGVGSQAIVMTTNIPKTTTRNFIVTSIYLPLTFLWLLASVLLVVAASVHRVRIGERAFWMTVTGIIVIVDVIIASFYATDIEFTKTLDDISKYTGVVLSGTGNLLIDTRMAAIFMTLVYLRFGFFFITNLVLLVWILIDLGRRTATSDSETGSESEPSTTVASGRNELQIPRVSLLRRLPSWMSGRQRSNTFSYEDYEASSRPATLANLMAERRRQLSESLVDTSARYPVRSAHALPDAFLEPAIEEPAIVDIHPLPSTSYYDPAGRRNTAAELQAQLPWSYIPPSAHRMRDNLPEDEDLPPVPVPDYTLHPKYRKASVHRAGSSVSTIKPNPLKGLTSDVLY